MSLLPIILCLHAAMESLHLFDDIYAARERGFPQADQPLPPVVPAWH